MEYPLGISSAAYLAFSYYRNHTFKNFIESNPPNLLQGKVFTNEPLRGIFKEGSLVYRQVEVNCVTKHTNKMQNNCESMAKNIFLKLPQSSETMLKNYKNGHMPLDMIFVEGIHKQEHIIRENIYSKIKKYFRILDQHNIPYNLTSNLTIREKYISNNSELTVYSHSHSLSSTQFFVKYMGPRDYVLDKIKRNVYGVRPMAILAATGILGASLGKILSDINQQEINRSIINYYFMNRY